jgi:hypothetical protein
MATAKVKDLVRNEKLNELRMNVQETMQLTLMNFGADVQEAGGNPPFAILTESARVLGDFIFTFIDETEVPNDQFESRQQLRDHLELHAVTQMRMVIDSLLGASQALKIVPIAMPEVTRH